MIERYITSGVQATIPAETQARMWSMYDNMPEKRDYLQVFNLKKLPLCNATAQRIVQTAEEPQYTASSVILRVEKAVEAKVYIFDDDDHVTMLLAEEY